MVRRTKSIEATIAEAEAFLGMRPQAVKKRIRKERGTPKQISTNIQEPNESKPQVKQPSHKLNYVKAVMKKQPKTSRKPPVKQAVNKVTQPVKVAAVVAAAQPFKVTATQPLRNGVTTVAALIPQPKQNGRGPRNTKSNLSGVSNKSAQVPIGMIDCVFVVDTTGSMDIYLERTTHTVQMLVEKVKEQTHAKDISVRFGFVAYRDHPPQDLTYVTQIMNLCTQKEILNYISKLDCQGGGDGAEAAFDGINEAATKIEWRDSGRIPSLRYIFHICDQPPHGREFGGYSEDWDDGCPCGLTLNQIAHRINVREIHYRLIIAHNRLQRFADAMKSAIVNYEEVTLDDGVADGMEIKISDMVIRELNPDILYD